MSCMLLGSSIVTAMLIDPMRCVTEGLAAEPGAGVRRPRRNRGININPLFGDVFGTIYDISTVSILWFAGASAMSGLLNLVPRYLPRYGMAPKWAEAVRGARDRVHGDQPCSSRGSSTPACVAQGGAYATGVMVLMSQRRRRRGDRSNGGSAAGRGGGGCTGATSSPSLVFFYTTVAIIIEKPDGIKIAGAFVLSVVVFSIISRTRRSTELRFEKFEFVDDHSRFLWDALRHLEFPVLVPHRPGHHTIIAEGRADPPRAPARRRRCRSCSSRRRSATPASFITIR